MRHEAKQKKIPARGVAGSRPGNQTGPPRSDTERAYLARGYLKWIVLKISALAGFSGTERGATRMEASNGTLVGGRQA